MNETKTKIDALVALIVAGTTVYVTIKQMDDTGFRYAPGTKFWYSVIKNTDKLTELSQRANAHAWKNYRNAAPYYDKV